MYCKPWADLGGGGGGQRRAAVPPFFLHFFFFQFFEVNYFWSAIVQLPQQCIWVVDLEQLCTLQAFFWPFQDPPL